ncbi:hypothetical protein ACMUMQ_04370 [Marinomonas sp. 2405UD66-6]|uniref:hypothetical protein n=1 Tax=Marinomonas sp. 2405UD66-6 TaxID=3391834 RepID=UPI0039C9FAF3
MRYFVLFLMTFAQLSFAGMTAMFVIFSAAGVVNNNEISEFQDLIFTLSFIVIPLSSIIVALTVLYFAWKKMAKRSYWLHLLPVFLTVIYCVYIVQFD